MDDHLHRRVRGIRGRIRKSDLIASVWLFSWRKLDHGRMKHGVDMGDVGNQPVCLLFIQGEITWIEPVGVDMKPFIDPKASSAEGSFDISGRF